MHDPFLRIGRTCRHCKHLAHHETHAGSDFMSSFASNINLIALAVVGRISNLEQYIQQILVRRGLLCIEDILDSKSTSQLYAVTSLGTNLPPNTKIAKGYPRVHHWYIIGTSLVHHANTKRCPETACWRSIEPQPLPTRHLDHLGLKHHLRRPASAIRQGQQWWPCPIEKSKVVPD